MALLAGIADAARTGSLFGDFRAFWCAGSTVLHGGDPYLASPLYACETSPQPFGLYRAHNGVALPAPLPGYALVPFAALALVPYPVACVAWLAALLLACAWAWRSLAALGAHDVAGAIWVAAAPLALVCLPFGELVPLAVAAICACGAALARGSPWTAAGCACVAAIEPHLGLPLLLALLVPRTTRLPSASAMLALAALDAAVSGAGTVAYFTHVLPQHALAELDRGSQYALSWILHTAGLAPSLALGIASASYALSTASGIWVAAILARRLRAPEMFALVPPAFALFGGAFVHLAQMLAALPLGLVLLPYARGKARWAVGAALVLLAIPWLFIAPHPWLVPFAALVAGGIAFVTLQLPPAIALRVALGAAVYASVAALVRAHVPITAPSAFTPPLDPALAQASWAAWIRLHDGDTSLGTWIAKAPTWLGLTALLACAVSLAREEHEARVGKNEAPPATIA